MQPVAHFAPIHPLSICFPQAFSTADSVTVVVETCSAREVLEKLVASTQTATISALRSSIELPPVWTGRIPVGLRLFLRHQMNHTSKKSSQTNSGRYPGLNSRLSLQIQRNSLVRLRRDIHTKERRSTSADTLEIRLAELFASELLPSREFGSKSVHRAV